jgi:hypothetical protein
LVQTIALQLAANGFEAVGAFSVLGAALFSKLKHSSAKGLGDQQIEP